MLASGVANLRIGFFHGRKRAGPDFRLFPEDIFGPDQLVQAHVSHRSRHGRMDPGKHDGDSSLLHTADEILHYMHANCVWIIASTQTDHDELDVSGSDSSKA